MRTETSILLPPAIVDLFLKDRPTIEAASSLAEDWRFARVAVRVHEGDVADAVKLYSQGKSADIVFIETDTTDDTFIAKLGELSGHCEETTSAIVIGPVNDVNLYRSLTAMGVSDYLVRPVPLDTLGDVIAQNLIEKLGTAGSRLIAVTGSKGGTGASSLSQAMALAASDILLQKTLLIDAAGGWSSLGVGMGFEPVASTAEAIKAAAARDQDSLRRMLYQAGERLSVLATGMESMLDTAPQISQFEEVLNMTMANYPLVIADLSAAPVAVRKMILTRAHEIVVVSTPTLSSLRSARTLMGEIRKLHGGQASNIDLIINMAGLAPGKEVARNDIKTALDMEPHTIIPFDPKLFIGVENEGRKMTSEKSGQEILQKILPLLQKMTKKEAPAPEQGGDSLLGSILGKIRVKK